MASVLVLTSPAGDWSTKTYTWSGNTAAAFCKILDHVVIVLHVYLCLLDTFSCSKVPKNSFPCTINAIYQFIQLEPPICSKTMLFSLLYGAKYKLKRFILSHIIDWDFKKGLFVIVVSVYVKYPWTIIHTWVVLTNCSLQNPFVSIVTAVMSHESSLLPNPIGKCKVCFKLISEWPKSGHVMDQQLAICQGNSGLDFRYHII